MKARTREEKHVLQLSKSLKPISEAAKKYAYTHCFEKTGSYQKNGWVQCLCCGNRSRLKSNMLGIAIGCANSYVCPSCGEKLQLAYYREEKAKKELERQIKEVEKYEEEYKEKIRNYTELSFGTDKIRIEPLRSVKDFAEEGMYMHHCVFTNEYYKEDKHPNTLILSARDNKGKRIETIEVNTKSWR